MTIRGKLHLFIILSAILGVTVVVGLIWLDRHEQQIQGQTDVLQEVIRNSGEMMILNHMIHIDLNERRASRQWLDKHRKLTGLIRSMIPVSAEAELLRLQLQSSQERLARLFAKIHAVLAKTGVDRGRKEALLDHLSTELEILSGEVLNDTLNMLEATHDHKRRYRQSWGVAIMVLVAALAATLMTLVLFMGRGMLRSLEALRRGTEHLGAGDLDYRVASQARDELGALAQAFNAMLERLQTISVSRDLLEREIQEHQETEARLADERALYQTLFDQAPMGILTADLETGMPRAFNELSHRQLGYSRDEFAALRITDHDAAPEEAAARLNRLRSVGREAFETRHRCKDGSLRDVLVVSRVIHYGGSTLLLIIFQDITDRKQAEQTLIESRSRLIQAQAMAHLGHWRWDVALDRVEWSEELYRIFGVTAEGFGHDLDSFLRLVHADDQEAVTRTVRQTLKNPDVPCELQLRVPHPDGSERRVHVRGEARCDDGGQVVAMVGTAQDVTDRSRMEEALRRSNEELEQFAYVSSHDLQEPLRKIVSFGNLLKAEYGDVVTGDGAYYIERMRNAALRMQTLIDALLSYSRLTSRAVPFVQCDMDGVLREVMDNLESRAQDAKITLDPLPGLEADPTQMIQLLQNLIGNALKFHEAGTPPEVKVSARILYGRKCEITVADNGIGFDEEQLERILKPFQRLHGRSDYEGSGIGLAICHKIVLRHGGTLKARSAPGKGAAFIVTLPLRQGWNQ